jgi:hypothetical protein
MLFLFSLKVGDIDIDTELRGLSSEAAANGSL